MVVVGDRLFVASEFGGYANGGSVSELDASSGVLVNEFDGPQYLFEHPNAMVAEAGHLFVANSGGDSVSELSVPSGALVKVIWGSQYHFDYPDALALAEGHLFVANQSGNSVTELNASTGRLIKVLVWQKYQFCQPDAIVAAGANLFVANASSCAGVSMGIGSVTELNASSGAMVKLIWGAAYQFDIPVAVAVGVGGGQLFVANQGTGRGFVTELSAETGSLVRVFSGARYHLAFLQALAASGDHLFVAGVPSCSGGGLCRGGEVTELDIQSATVARVMSGPSYDFDMVDALALRGSTLFVANGNGNSTTEVSTVTGSFLRLLLPVGSSARPLARWFAAPNAAAVVGADLFVVNGGEGYGLGSVTEVDIPTGHLVRILQGGDYQFYGADGIVADGDNLFVSNGDSDSLTEVSASTGALIRVIANNHIDSPGPLVVIGDNLFVASRSGGPTGYGSLAELNAATGTLVRVINNATSCDFQRPQTCSVVLPRAMTSEGNHLFVTGGGANWGFVAEFNPSNGGLQRVFFNTSLAEDPEAVAVSGNRLFVDAVAVSEFSLSSGSLKRTTTQTGSDFPVYMGLAQHELFVASRSSVTDYSVISGTEVRVAWGPHYRFDMPDAMVAAGPDLFVVNGGTPWSSLAGAGASVTEIDVHSGALVRVISAPA